MPEAGETESLRWYTRWKQVIKANMVRALQGFGDMRHLALSIATPPSGWDTSPLQEEIVYPNALAYSIWNTYKILYILYVCNQKRIPENLTLPTLSKSKEVHVCIPENSEVIP